MSRPYRLRPVTSLWVSTTCTPGIARASEMSMALMRAYGWGLRVVAPHSMSGACRSEEYSKRPRTLAAPSGLRTLSPTFICGQVHGIDDLRVAGAPADVAGERLADLRLCWLANPLQQVVCRDHQARRAEAALH